MSGQGERGGGILQDERGLWKELNGKTTRSPNACFPRRLEKEDERRKGRQSREKKPTRVVREKETERKATGTEIEREKRWDRWETVS